MSQSHVLLEVIATTVADARLAAQAGADRLELITAMGEGGLTPSVGLIEAVVSAVEIPVNVIVRPHSRSFVFDADDYAVMLRDVRAAATAGANGVVIGMLTSDGEIDREGLARRSTRRTVWRSPSIAPSTKSVICVRRLMYCWASMR
jgi:copper homeostasis protein